MDRSRIQFVTLTCFWNPINAWIMRNRLVDAGDDAFVIDEHFITTYWYYANAAGGIKIQIPLDQVEHALAVLQADVSTVFPSTPGDIASDSEANCPRCGSAEVYEEVFAVRYVYVSWFLLGFPLPIFSSAVECYDCGARTGAPKSFQQFGIWHLLVLTFIVACVLGIARATGFAWLSNAAMPVGQ